MPGIYGYIKNKNTDSQIDQVKTLVCNNKKPQILFEYKDDFVEFFQYTLNLYKNNYINNNEIVLAVEGKCYNIKELNEHFNLKCNYFSEILYWAYSNNLLNKLLNVTDGCFHFCLYDKNKKKIIIANDRFGLMPLYTYQNNNFAFAAEPKAILPLNFVDNKINDNSFEMFLNLGYLLGDNTWFEYIKCLKPATILTYNVSTCTLKQERYWTFAEVKKSDISFNEAVDKTYELFNNSIKRQVDTEHKYMLSLSAGFDSRLILACLMEQFPKMKPYVITFGVSHCQDIITAEKICKLVKLEHHKRYFDNEFDWFQRRQEFVYDCDSSFSMEHMHGLEFLASYPENTQININGYLGDTILGDTYLPTDEELWNTRISHRTAEYYYGDFAKYSDWDDEYFDIENPIPLHWINRGNNFINEAQRLCFNYIDVIRPFLDKNLIEFISSLPNEYLKDNKLYNHMVLKYYPKYFRNIPRNSDKPIFIKKDLGYRVRKILHNFSKKLRKWHMLPKVAQDYADYLIWIQEPNLNNKIRKLLLSENTFIQKYMTKEDILNLLNNIDFRNTSKILALCSVEIYFNMLNDYFGLNLVKINNREVK